MGSGPRYSWIGRHHTDDRIQKLQIMANIWITQNSETTNNGQNIWVKCPHVCIGKNYNPQVGQKQQKHNVHYWRIRFHKTSKEKHIQMFNICGGRKQGGF